MLSRLRRSTLLIAALAALGAVALLGGVALASGATAPPVPFAGTTAAANGDAGRLTAILDGLVQQGVITRDQADKIVAAVSAARPKPVPAVVKHDFVVAVANAIGIAPSELRTELPGRSLATVAQAHGVSRDTLVQKLIAAVDADVDRALADKKITSEQADRLKKNAPDTVAKAVDRVTAQPKVVAPRVKASAADLAAAAAKAIGISADQLKRELPGKSVAQVAQAHGVTRDAVVQSLTTAANDRIAAAAAAGKLTADQAARMKALAPVAIATFVDHVR